MRSRQIRVLMPLLLLAAGCGTTVVPVPGTDPAIAAGADGLGGQVEQAGAPASGSGLGTQGPASAALAEPGAAPGQAVTTAVPGQSAPGTSVKAGTGPHGAGPGVTPTAVTVGVAYTANIDAANRALGGDKITSGDQVANTEVLVRDINARGGLAGRRLVVDFFAYDAQSSEPYDSQDQAACAHFTQDVRVFAVIGAGLTSNFQQCMERAGGSVIGADIVRFDRADFTRYPHFYDVQEIELDTLMTALAGRLVEDDYFTGWDAALGRPGPGRATVGVVAFDEPRFRSAVRQRLVPSLAGKGVTVSDDNLVFVQPPASSSDIGQAATQLQSAVLRFRQNGVGHVILVDTHGGITQVFLKAADSQGYYPRYGMESGSGTQALLDARIITARQLNGATGLGWIPTLDLPAGDNPLDGPYSGADRRRCLALMKAGGQQFTSTNAESIALLYCDQVWLLERAVGSSGAALTRAGLRTGIERLGARAPAANLGSASYGPGKHFGVARAFRWTFQADCDCMTYQGRAQEIR